MYDMHQSQPSLLYGTADGRKNKNSAEQGMINNDRDRVQGPALDAVVMSFKKTG